MNGLNKRPIGESSTGFIMKSLNLKEAAELLNMSMAALRRKASNGTVPGAKPGKKWVFIEEDLVFYLRMFYTKSQEHNRSKRPCSLSAVKYGGSTSNMTTTEYERALGQRIRS